MCRPIALNIPLSALHLRVAKLPGTSVPRLPAAAVVSYRCSFVAQIILCMDLPKDQVDREETQNVLRKLEAIWRKAPVELPAVHLSLDQTTEPDPLQPKQRKTKSITFSRARVSFSEDDDSSQLFTASQEARRPLKLQSPTKGWIDEPEAEQAQLHEASSSPPTSFLPTPSVGPLASKSSVSTQPSPSKQSTQSGVGSWISKGASSLSPFPSPAKKTRSPASASRRKKQQKEELAELLIPSKTTPKRPLAVMKATDAVANADSDAPEAARPKRTRSSSTRTAATRTRKEIPKNAQKNLKGIFDDSSSAEEEDDDETDGFFRDVEDVVAPEKKKQLHKLLKDKNLRELYL